MPKVSVILSSYNHAEYISESIQSILAQTFEDFELYIIDDCSTDNSWEIIKQFKDDRIVAIRNEKNIGVVIRPEIIDRLKGEYIAMAHCDDRWEPTKLEKQVKFLDAHKDYAACFTLVRLIDDDGMDFADKSHPQYTTFKQKNRSRLEWLQRFFYYGNALCHPSVLLRTKIQKEYNLYTSGMAALPDEYRWVKICLHKNIYVYPEELTDFRIRGMDGNTSGDKIDNRLRCNFENFVMLDLFRATVNYSKNDFLAIYPSSKKYFIDGRNDMEYIFARTLVDIEYRPYQLYGLKLLWEIMQDPTRKKMLETKYKFTNRDFVKLSGSIDVFNFLADGKSMISTVYYDTGNGFNQNQFITKKVYVNGQGNFSVDFDLSHIRHIQNLRFDPFEELYAELKDVAVFLDGKKMEYDMSAHKTLDDGFIKFDDGDPQLIIVGCSGNILTIKGIAKIPDCNEISRKLRELEKQAQQTRWQKIKKRIKGVRK